MEYGNLKKNIILDSIIFVTINSVADTELRHLENVFSHNIQDVSSSRRELPSQKLRIALLKVVQEKRRELVVNANVNAYLNTLANIKIFYKCL